MVDVARIITAGMPVPVVLREGLTSHAHNSLGLAAFKLALTADGAYAITGGSNRQLTDALFFGPLLSIGRQRFDNVLMKPNQGDLPVLEDLCELER